MVQQHLCIHDLEACLIREALNRGSEGGSCICDQPSRSLGPSQTQPTLAVRTLNFDGVFVRRDRIRELGQPAFDGAFQIEDSCRLWEQCRRTI